MCYFFLAFPMHFFCSLQISPQNSGFKIFGVQLYISRTFKHYTCLTSKSKEDTYLTSSSHEKANVSIKVTNFIILKDNESYPFNISAYKYHWQFPLLELPISYVKYYFKFFSLVLNHFTLKEHLTFLMNNIFIKKMFKSIETIQFLMNNFFLLVFLLFFEIKFLMNKLKTNERKKHKNVLIFVIFFINSYQLFCGDNLTLIITNLNDFDDIDQYKDITKFIYISEGIYSIPSGAFSEWPSVVSVNFGNSISDIGIYVFSSCSNLETIIFGGNVTTIGGGAFSFCSNLTLLILGYGIREIGGSAFGNCYQLECIYYYGETEPEIGEGAFYNVSTSVITYPTYKGSKFGHLGVTKENAEGTCNPIPTHSFSASHTFSNTYSQSNTFSRSNAYSNSNTFSAPYSFSSNNTYSQSNTFTESFQNDLTKSFSYLLTVTLSFTQSFTYYEIQTKSLSLIAINSSYIYIETEFIYYDYTVIIYSTYYNYYSNFFTFIYSNEFQTNDNKTTIIIIIVCVIIVVIIIIIIIISILIILLLRIKNKKEEIAENEISEQQNDNNQSTNTFTTGISISNIEEDPFADDFKEDKFIVQM